MDTKAEDAIAAENDSFAPEYRDRLRTWLVKMINSQDIAGLCWENEEQTIFRMPWKHAGRQDYNLEEDSKIFMAWARHSGRYREGIDKPEPIVWKTRLRCALNKMPDIRELPDRSRLDISEPYRVYQLLPPVHKASQIRRRMYKRSQSQDIDHHVRNYSDQSHPLPLLTSPEREGEFWAKQITLPRRSTSMEAAQANLPTRTSPLTSVPPGIWLAPSVSVPLKAPMSAALPGLSLPQTVPLTIDAVDPLRTLAHTQYPLPSSLHSHFVPFSGTSIPPLFPSSHPNLAAFKQLGLTPRSSAGEHVKQMTLQAMAAEKSYQDQLALTVSKKLEEQNRTRAERPEYLLPDEKILCQKMADMDSISSQKTQLHKHIFDQQNQPNKSNDRFQNMQAIFGSTNLESVPQLHHVHVQLTNLQRKIEDLEKDLTASRTAHAQEREARKKLESEYQRMNFLLQHAGQNFTVPKLNDQPQVIRPKTWKNCASNSRYVEKTNPSPQSDVRRLYEENTVSKARFYPEHESSATVKSLLSSSDQSSPKSAFIVIRRSSHQMQDRPVFNRANSQEAQRKRSSLPLDLTVHSPTKLQRLSCGEEMEAVKSSPTSFCVNPSFMTSSTPSVASCDVKCVISSPLSASSESSGPHSFGATIGPENGGSSMSPPQRTSNLLQTRHGQGRIEVA